MEQSQMTPGQLAGQVLFYNNPEPLNVEMHGSLGVNRTEKPYAFVGRTHVVPLTVTEFAAAALSFPIVFVGDAKTPLAVMGLQDGANLFVSPQGDFKPEAYIPAFVRRYPFVFANDDANERLILCVDRLAPFISDKPDVPFFENGQPSAYTQNAMQFCNEFEGERRRTDSFIDMLKDLDLFVVREAVFTPANPDGTPGTPQKIADYYAVSEEKLRELPPAKFVELRDNGALGQIYAHIISLLGWDRLIAMAFERAQREQGAAGRA
jgi:hypothetical protein